jgi:hypothetical protein
MRHEIRRIAASLAIAICSTFLLFGIAPEARAAADLITQNLIVSPTSGSAGSTVTISFTIKNNGTSATTNASTTNIRLSTSNANVTTSDPLLTTVSVPSLAVSATYPVSVNVTVPAGSSTGTQYVWIILDVNNTTGQNSTGIANDKTNTPFSVTVAGVPDLITQNLTVNPTSGAAGSAATINFTIRNNGTAATTNASTTNIRLSTSSANVTTSDPLLTTVSVPSLGVGATYPVSVNVTIPTGAATGTQYVWIILDVNNTTGQNSAGIANDKTNTPFSVTVAGVPDLITQNLTVNPTSGAAGSAATISFTIRNNGTAATTNTSTTNIRLSTSNANVTTSDPLLTSVSVPSLGVGATYPVSINVTIPAGASTGTQYVWVILDVNNTTGQNSTGIANDKTNTPFMVTAAGVPDLITQNLSVSPTSGVAGSTVTVSFTILNNGTAATVNASTTNIRLSTSNANVTTSDPLLTTVSVPSLGVGATYPVSVNVTIPAGSSTGTQYVWIILDVNNTTGQNSAGIANDKTNTPFTVTVAGVPDLITQNLTVNPTSGAAGSAATISFTIRNNGTAATTNTSTTNIRLSTSNANVTTSDPLLTTVSVPSLGVGATYPVSVNVTIPAGAATGTQYVWIILDVNNTTGQNSTGIANDKTNTSFTITTAGVPDLITQNLSVSPTSGVVGSTVTVSFTILNNGTAATVNASTTNIRLSTSNANVTTSDPLLTTVSVPSLGVGATYPVSVNVTIPAGAATGTQYVWIILDVNNTTGQNSAGIANDKTNTPFTVTVAGVPDLITQNLTVNPTSGAAGSAATISFTIRNNGTAATTNASTTNIRLSTSNANVATSDPLLTTVSVPSLGVGATYPVSVNVTIPTGSSTGTQYVWVILDVNNTTGQNSTGIANDKTNTPFSVTTAGVPDLITQNLSVSPTSAVAGSTVTVSFTILNNGTAATVNASTTNIRLSTSNANVTTSDPLLTTVSVPSLGVGATYPVSVNVTIPAGAATGTQYVWIILDVNNTTGQNSAGIANDKTNTPFTVTAAVLGGFVLSNDAPTCTANVASIRLTWTPSAGASAYDVYRNSIVIASGIFATTYADSSLLQGQTYTYLVRARAGGVTADSNPVSVAIPANLCSTTTPPKSFSATATPSCRATTPPSPIVVLAWSAADGAATYTLFRNGQALGQPVPASTLTYQDVVSPGQTYSYFVRAENNAGATDTPPVVASVPADICAQPIPPAPPSSFGAIASSSSEIRLTWQESSSDVSGFKLERRLAASGSFTQLAALPKSFAYTDQGLSPQTSYCYRLRAWNASGDSAYSSESCATTNPLASFTLTAAARCNTSGGVAPAISLSWQSFPGATSYTIFRNGASYAGPFSPATLAFDNTASVSSGTTYTYLIRAAVGSQTVDSASAVVSVAANICDSAKPQTIGVILTPSQSSGYAPLDNVTFRATLTGTSKGPATYIFYCDRNDEDTGVTPNYLERRESLSDAPLPFGPCSFDFPGIHGGKIIVSRGGTLVAQATAPVTVTASPLSICGGTSCITISGHVTVAGHIAIRGGDVNNKRTVTFTNTVTNQVYRTDINPSGGYSLTIPPGAYRAVTLVNYDDYTKHAESDPLLRRSPTRVSINTSQQIFSSSATFDVAFPSPLVLVHGVNSTPDEKWQSWIDVLSIGKPGRSGYISFAPDYAWCDVPPGSESAYSSEAATVYAQIERDFAALFAATPNYRIIAHSKGGLVTRTFLHDFSGTPLGDAVTDLVMLGTPNSGIGAACADVIRDGLFFKKCTQDLQLTERWITPLNAALGAVPTHVTTHVIAGTAGFGNGGASCAPLSGPNDGGVPVRSVMMADDGKTQQLFAGIAVPSNHTELGSIETVGLLNDVILPYYDGASFPQCPASVADINDCLRGHGYSGTGSYYTCNAPSLSSQTSEWTNVLQWSAPSTGLASPYNVSAIPAAAALDPCRTATSSAFRSGSGTTTGGAFRIYRSNQPILIADASLQIGSTTGDATSFIDFNPPAGTVYYVVSYVAADGHESPPSLPVAAGQNGRRRAANPPR